MSSLPISLVIDVHENRLRSALFAPVEHKMRLIALAECQREESLSSTVEHLAASLARQTGFDAVEIQRDPIFIVSGADDLSATSIRMMDRRQAVAAACQSLAQARGYPVVAIERAADGSEITITSLEHGRAPLIDTIVIGNGNGNGNGDGAGRVPNVAYETAIDAVRQTLAEHAITPGLVILSESCLPRPDGVALLSVADMAADLAYDTIVVVADTDDLLCLAGALDDASLESVVQHDLLPYGVVLRVSGDPLDGILAIRGVVESGGSIVHRFSVPWGCVQHIDTPRWKQSSVRCATVNGAVIGSESRCVIPTGAGTDVGRAGMLLDARPTGAVLRGADQQEAWLDDVGADPASLSRASFP